MGEYPDQAGTAIKARHINFIVIKYLRQSKEVIEHVFFEKTLAWLKTYNAIEVDDDSKMKVTLKLI